MMTFSQRKALAAQQRSSQADQTFATRCAFEQSGHVLDSPFKAVTEVVLEHHSAGFYNGYELRLECREFCQVIAIAEADETKPASHHFSEYSRARALLHLIGVLRHQPTDQYGGPAAHGRHRSEEQPTTDVIKIDVRSAFTRAREAASKIRCASINRG
jgi:hypothetical protein